jgi:PrtD family type I secretion system ABC transporter
MTHPTQPKNELRDAISESKAVFWHLGIFSFFVNLLMLTGPLYMLQVYDRVLASSSIETLVGLTVIVFVLYLALALLEWVRSALFNEASSAFEDVLGERATDAAIEASLKDPGMQSERPVRDLRAIRKFLGGPAPKAVFDAPWTPLFFIVLFALHWSFGLWALFGATVLFVLGLINQRSSSKLMAESEELERVSQMRAVEMVRNAEVMEAMGMRETLRSRWREVFDASDGAMTKSGQILSGFTSGTKSFRLFLQSAILGLGAYLAIKGVSTPGAMIAASIIMGRAIAPIEQLVGQWRSVVSAKDAWTSLKGFLELSPEAEDGMTLPPIKGHVSLEGIFAGPPGATKPVLRNLNFVIEPGDVLGVIGPSAAGKSTLARLMTGVWKPLAGHVRIDGADLSSWSRREIGPQIGYMPQQVDLMSGTIRDNISRFKPDADPAGIIDAAKAAGCHELILRMPEGYDSQIGMSGAYLSAGQRQRVGLARALYGNPSFVVLDEPNSNLDAPGDEALQAAILGLKARGATTILIAHRPNAIVHCNKLLVLESGEIKAFGPRDEVLAAISPKRQNGNVRTIRGGEPNG